MLLHSGPPFNTIQVKPILNSGAFSCVFKGWAKSLGEADNFPLLVKSRSRRIKISTSRHRSPPSFPRVWIWSKWRNLGIRRPRHLHLSKGAVELKFMLRGLASNPRTHLPFEVSQRESSNSPSPGIEVAYSLAAHKWSCAMKLRQHSPPTQWRLWIVKKIFDGKRRSLGYEFLIWKNFMR